MVVRINQRFPRAAGKVDDAYDALKSANRIDESLDNAKAATRVGTGPACFVAGTLVHTAEGYKNIEDIQVGDYVWAWDEETGNVALKRVLETYIHEKTELVHVFANGEEIIATTEHPFYSPVKGWTAAVDLRAGDILVLVNGEYVVVEKVQHELLENPINVYNFQVEDYHTYYVAEFGILVHNDCSANGVNKKKFNGDQQAVLELAKENKNGLTEEDANTLVDWAEEYGIKSHRPMTHENRGGIWSDTMHINIRSQHIRIITKY